MLQRFIRRVRRLAARPWCALILRCGASLSCGALMAGASALGLPVPVALAWLCAMDFGAEAVCAYAGAAAGYLLLWELADVLEPLAAGFLILSGLGLFRGLLPEERWFRALAGSALYAVVSLIFLLQGPMQPFEIIFFFLRLMVLSGAAFAFSGAQRGKARLLALIAGSTRLLLPGGLPLGAAAAAGAVCCALDGPGWLLAATVCGLTVDICWQPMLSATLTFSAAALAAHSAPLHTRLGRALLFACGCAVCVFASGGLEPGLFLLALAGSLLSCLLPRLDWEELQPEPPRSAAAGAVMGELARALRTPAEPEDPQSAPRVPADSPEARMQRLCRARLREARVILAEQYDALGRLLQRAPETEKTPRPEFRAELGVRTRGRCAGADGDRAVSFRAGEWLYLLLCDGMGTGAEAQQEAEEACRLLRQMIESGFDAQDAMQTLNALYLLRGDGVFSTLDLAQVSLVSGEGFLHKWGAAPSYLRSGRGIEKIGTTSPPPGLGAGETHRPVCVRLSMRRGEVLVLVSDGVEEQAALRALHSEITPAALAAGIVSRGQEPDDRSAAALRLRPVPSWHKNSTTQPHFLSKLGQDLYI